MGMCQRIMFRFCRKRVINICSHNSEVSNPKGIAWKCERLATNVCWQNVHKVTNVCWKTAHKVTNVCWLTAHKVTNVCWQTAHKVPPCGYPLFSPRSKSKFWGDSQNSRWAACFSCDPPTLSSTFSLSGQIFVMALPSRNQTQPRRSTCLFSYTLQQCTSRHATTSSSRCFNLFPNGLCQKDERGTDWPIPEQ